MKLEQKSGRPAEFSFLQDLPDETEIIEPRAGELRPKQVLDARFVIDVAIYRGGMGTIYQAHDAADHNEPVAIKVPHLNYESDPKFFSRFQREEEIGRKLNHPFILKFIPTDGKSRPYIVTELLRGWTLAHALGHTRPLPEHEALKIASLVCDALHHMHWRGVVHRDLKPGNIMLCRDGTIRIMDFGISSAAHSRKITMGGLGGTMGTPDYMAPEQVKNARTDERTDVYCLGAILYEMFTGVVPFQNENTWSAMNDRVTGDPVAPRKINPNLTPQAEEIVLHAMQREPGERYQTAAAMKVELDAPQSVRVTGYANRLQGPHWRMSLQGTPVLTGTLIGIGFLSFQALLFLLLRHWLSK
jgi:serine/threonine-protein kinase